MEGERGERKENFGEDRESERDRKQEFGRDGEKVGAELWKKGVEEVRKSDVIPRSIFGGRVGEEEGRRDGEGVGRNSVSPSRRILQ